ncbi:MAG: GNAT family N-acetyltransferase [Alphaproteobacteria bacterium]|nr:GNAT family N-acetyltransferase [Alphaproteobacteria bacterium]
MSTGSASPPPASWARPSRSDDGFATARLTATPYAPSDLADAMAMRAHPDVTRHLGSQTGALEDGWSRVYRNVGHWAVQGYGYWALRETATGRFVGEVGAADFQRALTPPLGPGPELGWALVREVWGQGLAKEAVAGALVWLDRRLGPGRRTCFINEGNDASIAVARHSGFREFARGHYKEMPVILFERAGVAS